MNTTPSTVLAGRLVVVTGAGRGIGLAIAKRMAASGAHLALCARTSDELEAAAMEIGRATASGGERFHVEMLARACDISDAEQVGRFADAVRERFGVARVVVNNAGIVERGRLDEQSPAEWKSVIDVNFMGTYHVTRAFLPGMRLERAGRIINVSSISGRLGTPRLTAYCAAKHAVIGLTRALAEEVRSDGIQVNAVCPGSVDTEMLKGSGFEPAMTPDDVARTVYFLAAEAPNAMTGACLDVFG